MCCRLGTREKQLLYSDAGYSMFDAGIWDLFFGIYISTD
jgi:hypothetical protein